MTRQTARFLKVRVTFERRSDGGLRAYSDDVPGLMLSGPNPEAVFEDVIPALEKLFLHNRGMRVEFAPVSDVRSNLEDVGLLPDEELETREYVSPITA